MCILILNKVSASKVQMHCRSILMFLPGQLKVVLYFSDEC